MTTEKAIHHVDRVHLTTQRLLIREWSNSDDDEADLLAIDSRPEVVRFMDFNIRDEFNIKHRLCVIRQCRRSQPRQIYECAIEIQTTGRTIGLCVLAIEDEANLQGHITYRLHPDYWGRGYAKETAREMLRFGFEDVGLQRIRAVCDSENTTSLSVLTAIGMKPVGTLHVEIKQEQRERHMYATSKDQWQALKQTN